MENQNQPQPYTPPTAPEAPQTTQAPGMPQASPVPQSAQSIAPQELPVQPQAPAVPQPVAEVAPAPSPAPAMQEVPAAPIEEPVLDDTTAQPEPAGMFDDELPQEQDDALSVESLAPISWSAQEYVPVDRNAWWFVIFGLAVAALAALSVFLLKSWSFSALIIVMAVALIIYVRRPPRDIAYTLSFSEGLYVGEQLYPFDNFKAFGVIQDNGNNSIMLIPRKRFSPAVSVFFPEEVGEALVDALGSRIPMENLKLDIIDTVVRKLRL